MKISSGFRPLIRGFFFYYSAGIRIYGRCDMRVSVPSFGDSFFMTINNEDINGVVSPCFRPLIRGFFFYHHSVVGTQSMSTVGFRPLIRGFFFYKCR